MESANSEERRRLQNERTEVKHQKERICKKLREVTNRYLTAVAAVHSARRLIGIYDDPEDPEACGKVYHFAVKGSPGHTQLEILDAGEIPDHVQDAIEAVEENEDQCAPGYWRREETAVAAITVEEKVVFRVADQESLERLYEKAQEKRRQLRTEVEDHYQKFEQLEIEHNRREDLICNDLLSKTGREKPEAESTEEKGEPPTKSEWGYHGAEYAKEAKEILDNFSITKFTALESKMEELTVGGGSKVDTVKRNIGYDDLPKEEKGFPRFREMLRKKVEQLEKGD